MIFTTFKILLIRVKLLRDGINNSENNRLKAAAFFNIALSVTNILIFFYIMWRAQGSSCNYSCKLEELE